jgi:glycosyltransferase involved in cell wall biosynthesis
MQGLSPAEGGGYVFTVELLKALNRLRGSTSHELMVCWRGRAPESVNALHDFPVLDFDARRASVLTTRERISDQVPNIINRMAHFALPAPEPAPSWDERVLRLAGIDFVVRLSPWVGMTLDIPYATTLWDLQHRINPWFPEVSSCGEWNRREQMFSELLRRASLIYVGLHEHRNQICHYYQVPRERIKVLVSPCPSFVLAPETASQSRAAEVVRADYLFYPAQFWPHKNHVVILEACKSLRERENWDLRIVFTGSDKGNEQFIRNYARRLSLDEVVSFLGLVEQSQLINLYKNAFCLVYPTFCGPEGIPPMEAFSLGCPVCASDIPGAREQLGEAALLFPPTDANALADCIRKFRDGGIRKKMIDAGRKTANATSWDDFAKGIIESLDEFSLVRRTWS